MQQPFPQYLDRFSDRPVFSHCVVKWYLQGAKRKWPVACVSPGGPATDVPDTGVRSLWAPGAFIFVAVVSFIACSDLHQKCVWAGWMSVNLCCLLPWCYSPTETLVNGKNIVTASTCITEEVAGSVSSFAALHTVYVKRNFSSYSFINLNPYWMTALSIELSKAL